MGYIKRLFIRRRILAAARRYVAANEAVNQAYDHSELDATAKDAVLTEYKNAEAALVSALCFVDTDTDSPLWTWLQDCDEAARTAPFLVALLS